MMPQPITSSFLPLSGVSLPPSGEVADGCWTVWKRQPACPDAFHNDPFLEAIKGDGRLRERGAFQLVAAGTPSPQKSRRSGNLWV
ncbi:hypothetical protein Pla52o_46480 [Novipirellula galeiformis]|uniref:Uncharacterized protein n=1 Tax=Novipirellula galeiformis TaxID=2528004 RepID=A0A5C6C9R9_9BACT|nr:hypothetical protein Pla52o_46480 [Novipirellula galeiformis]